MYRVEYFNAHTDERGWLKNTSGEIVRYSHREAAEVAVEHVERLGVEFTAWARREGMSSHSYTLYRRDSADLRSDQVWERVASGFDSIEEAARHALSVPDGVFLVDHTPSGFWTNCQWLDHAGIRARYPV